MLVALREFVSTVTTKGFILGVLVSPFVAAVMIIVMPMLINDKPPKVDGEVAVIDPTGAILPQLRAYLQPEAIALRSDELSEKILEQVPEELRKMAAAGDAEATSRQMMEQILGQVPEFHVNQLQPGADLEQEKSLLHEGSITDGGRLAIVVVHDDAVVKPPGAEAWGTYDLYVREKLDDRLEDEIKGGMYAALVSARARAENLDPDEIQALTRVGRIRSRTVTAGGEEDTNEVFNLLMPVGFMVLLLMAVFTGGQNLMTTVIEEKSSRVVEVLLSAVSPMQLMAGKIIGQMAVGLILMGVYAGMGIAAMISFTMMGMLDPWLFFYLLIFFIIAYSIMGSLMAAIGAAVNELREAQSLMMPVIMTMMLPWILWMPITRDPNSVFAVTASFIPPINTFVMLLRLTSTSPPPDWQVWITILIGIASVYAALWVAAKVFKVGLLMHGKPPDFRTLVRWVRMA
jgi:ABC-type Na+ efflux pump permease subunit